jgi:hypothetical protein
MGLPGSLFRSGPEGARRCILASAWRAQRFSQSFSRGKASARRTARLLPAAAQGPAPRIRAVMSAGCATLTGWPARGLRRHGAPPSGLGPGARAIAPRILPSSSFHQTCAPDLALSDWTWSRPAAGGQAACPRSGGGARRNAVCRTPLSIRPMRPVRRRCARSASRPFPMCPPSYSSVQVAAAGPQPQTPWANRASVRPSPQPFLSRAPRRCGVLRSAGRRSL